MDITVKAKDLAKLIGQIETMQDVMDQDQEYAEGLRARLNSAQENVAQLEDQLRAANEACQAQEGSYGIILKDWIKNDVDRPAKIQTIKECRQITGLGLRDAKHLCEQLDNFLDDFIPVVLPVRFNSFNDANNKLVGVSIVFQAVRFG
jgi:ribosomal protein L7/L12